MCLRKRQARCDAIFRRSERLCRRASHTRKHGASVCACEAAASDMVHVVAKRRCRWPLVRGDDLILIALHALALRRPGRIELHRRRDRRLSGRAQRAFAREMADRKTLRSSPATRSRLNSANGPGATGSIRARAARRRGSILAGSQSISTRSQRSKRLPGNKKPASVGGPSSDCQLGQRETLERAKGLEPSTPTLARSCSTTELHPHPRWRRLLAGNGRPMPNALSECNTRARPGRDEIARFP